MNFLKRQSGSCVAFNGGKESSQISLKRSSFVFKRGTKVLRVWNDMMNAGNYIYI